MAAIGLVLDIVGVLLLGWIAPAGSVLVAGTAKPRAKTPLAKLAAGSGMYFLLAGFAFQLVAQLRS